MPRQSAVPTPGKTQTFFLNLHKGIALDLHVYTEVLGAQKTSIINRAVRELIDRELELNAGIRSKFKMLKAELLLALPTINRNHVGLRVLHPPKGPKPSKSSKPKRRRRSAQPDGVV